MQNQNNKSKKIPDISETVKGRKGIKEMLDRLMHTDENGDPEQGEAAADNKTIA